MPYFAVERDPQKRKVKPPQALFELDDDLESSDDSDFRIEDHDDESDDDSIDSNANGKNADGAEASESDSEDLSDLDDAAALEATNKDAEDYINNLSDNVNKKKFNPKDALKIMICTVCLGDRSDPANEIIECDNCGVTVHEGCYGVQDSDSVCSTDSPCPTTPWFCDACKAGLKNAQCELCPNFGGIFKETDVGKWVHLVCALYMPGVAFGEVDKLQNVTLFEMSYTKWGQKACSLCRDQRFARTGVCVGCDAGMCKTYFHVTWARKRNWLALQMRMEEIRKNKKEEAELQRIQRRLAKYRKKYMASRSNRLQPWVPTQKMPRLLTTSASACRALWRKAELSGADTQSLALRETQVEALAEIHKRWNIPPAFSVEFIAYYLDRNSRITSLRKQVIELSDENSRLLDEQAVTEEKKDKFKSVPSTGGGSSYVATPSAGLSADAVNLVSPTGAGGGPAQAQRNTMKKREDAPVNCSTCKQLGDSSNLVTCDECLQGFHFQCLDPPVKKSPKVRGYSWHCANCDPTVS
ncbi:unnamed protein product [Nesidiocoris tenuis]|uniref:PHD-type domain-containing protein n=1 Tax=Nesidiocoris tenuis TaxID=355587 RepID=A0A6H5H7L0_9HEMI|nr:unnamed protein product [Nesidiocoris tenuis]